MKRLLVISIAVMLIFAGCSDDASDKKYKVTIADDFPIVNELKQEYSVGEEVTIKLETNTEHYYVLTVNGTEQKMDRENSDMVFTYFTFTMPNEDVTVTIGEEWVDIPEA